ncbi:hypothetical protein GCM10025880_56400 [Methylorubrum aminovorans]|uniref:hypothetical protein n=1 Tax=Methylorubrum aminovorans TaxID=269069 RepID=UPI0023E9BAAA|nr:hypothetical protein [Methylorubrum aminovorans]GMA79223.1 hypothetical protein GCM10025880_56400 [Methylorubrum aminovorans]
MKLELETKTTYSARLGHFYLSERPSEDDPQIAALEGMLKLFDPPFPGDRPTIGRFGAKRLCG